MLLADPARATDSHVIAVSVAPEQSCPGPRQVTDALAARLPGVVLPHGQPVKPGMLRLTVATDATGGIRIDLADPEGAPLLHRVLAATRGPGECAALADTIALIIERYWREVGYDAPPLPPPNPPQPPPPPSPPPKVATPPPPAVEAHADAPPTGDEGASGAPLQWSVAAAIAGRAGEVGAREASVLIALAAQARIGIRVSGGVSNGTTVVLGAAQADFRRFPVRVGGYLPIRTRIGQLEPGLGLDLDVLSFGTRNNSGAPAPQASTLCTGHLCTSPGVDLALGWSVASSRHVYVRALARAGIAVPYDFEAENGEPIWRTPSTYLELALECGLWFP
jgi:hypothetical protein